MGRSQFLDGTRQRRIYLGKGAPRIANTPPPIILCIRLQTPRAEAAAPRGQLSGGRVAEIDGGVVAAYDEGVQEAAGDAVGVRGAHSGQVDIVAGQPICKQPVQDVGPRRYRNYGRLVSRSTSIILHR